MDTDILKQFDNISKNRTQDKPLEQDTIVINNFTDLKILRDDWEQLHQESEIPNFFTSFEWIKCIWNFNQDIGEPVIYVYHTNNNIIAILPLLKIKTNDKTIISLLQDPFSNTIDIIFNLKNINLVSSWLIKTISNFDFIWHEIRFENITANCLITKLIKSINKHSNLKSKLNINNKISYIPLRILANNWQSWHDQQSPVSINAFSQLLDKYKDQYKIFVKTNTNTKNNLLTTELIHHDLQSILDLKLKSKIINTTKRRAAINAFLESFKNLDNYKHLLRYYHWYNNNEKLTTQYLLINNSNSYYVATEKLVGIEQSAKVYLQSIILKHCFDQNINKFYISNDTYAWQKFWHNEHEHVYEFILSNC